jgi:hypothetical protein
LAGGEFSLDAVLGMARGLSRAASQLHGRGISHGDFYAHNVLWNSAGSCLLGDFGAAFIYPKGAELEKIEVRAFGILLGELLERCEAAADDGITMKGLWDLQNRCAVEVVNTRPDFTEILGVIERFLCGASTEN